MNLMNIGISETIRDHLIKQRARAMTRKLCWAPENPALFCQYRGDNGTMCAVGCLIPDSQYDESFEGEPINGTNNAQDLRRLLNKLYPGVDMSMLVSWQRYHDGTDYQSWVDGEEGSTSPTGQHDRILAHL